MISLDIHIIVDEILQGESYLLDSTFQFESSLNSVDRKHNISKEQYTREAYIDLCIRELSSFLKYIGENPVSFLSMKYWNSLAKKIIKEKTKEISLNLKVDFKPIKVIKEDEIISHAEILEYHKLQETLYRNAIINL
jgi:hypothetical protein